MAAYRALLDAQTFRPNRCGSFLRKAAKDLKNFTDAEEAQNAEAMTLTEALIERRRRLAGSRSWAMWCAMALISPPAETAAERQSFAMCAGGPAARKLLRRLNPAIPDDAP